MLENVNKEEGEVAATEAEEAKGLLAQRVAAFEGEEKAPLQTGAAEWMKREGSMDLWKSNSDTNSSSVCRLLFYILTSANRIPDPGAGIVQNLKEDTTGEGGVRNRQLNSPLCIHSTG